ncbi:MAG: class I SAM-dependent methyltransferase [Sandaracinaceae bacterium]
MTDDRSDAQRALYEDEARARAYDRLVRAEDCDENVRRVLASRLAPRGKHLVEVGAGTGRLTRTLLDLGASVHATERAAPMLELGRKNIAGDVTWTECDARALPIEDDVAEGFVAGWVFGHFRLWMPDGWREEVGQAFAEARRVVQPGGTLVVFETLGTGVETPQHRPALEEFFSWLETEQGLTREVISTDYEFDSADAAAECLGGFFGEDMAARIRAKSWARVPEFTGVWSGPV